MFHFYFEAPNISDWITVILTIIGLGVGIAALNQWEKEKQWDLLLEGKTKADDIFNYLKLYKFFLIKGMNDIIFNQEITDGKSATTFYVTYINSIYRRYDGIGQEAFLIYEKLKSGIHKPNVVIDFYSLVYSELKEIQLGEWKSVQKLQPLIKEELFNSDFDSADTNKKIFNFLNSGYYTPDDKIEELEKLLKEVKHFKMRKWWYLF